MHDAAGTATRTSCGFVNGMKSHKHLHSPYPSKIISWNDKWKSLHVNTCADDKHSASSSTGRALLSKLDMGRWDWPVRQMEVKMGKNGTGVGNMRKVPIPHCNINGIVAVRHRSMPSFRRSRSLPFAAGDGRYGVVSSTDH